MPITRPSAFLALSPCVVAGINRVDAVEFVHAVPTHVEPALGAVIVPFRRVPPDVVRAVVAVADGASASDAEPESQLEFFPLDVSSSLTTPTGSDSENANISAMTINKDGRADPGTKCDRSQGLRSRSKSMHAYTNT